MIREPVAVALHLDERKLGAQEFKRLSDRAGLIRERRIKREQARENFGKPGRDVRGFGGVMSGFLQRAGWLPHMQIAALTEDWASIVGDVLAAHTRVERLADTRRAQILAFAQAQRQVIIPVAAASDSPPIAGAHVFDVLDLRARMEHAEDA